MHVQAPLTFLDIFYNAVSLLKYSQPSKEL